MRLLSSRRFGISRWGGLATLAVALGLCPAFATTIFNNINNSPDPICCGYAVGLYPGSNPGASFLIAFPFTVQASSYRLDTVGLVESMNGAIGPAPSGLNLFLFANSAGTPSQVLEFWQGVPVTAGIAVETVSSVIHPFLQVEQEYWLGVTTTNPQETALWWVNPASTLSTECGTINGGSYSCSPLAAGAFEILGTATPEPRSFDCALSALIMLAGVRWRRRRTSTPICS